jgi:hypothetical protein
MEIEVRTLIRQRLVELEGRLARLDPTEMMRVEKEMFPNGASKYLFRHGATVNEEYDIDAALERWRREVE